MNPDTEEIIIDIGPIHHLHEEPKTIGLADFAHQDDYLLTFHPVFPLVAVSREAFRAAVEHACSHMDIEVGGVCRGQVYRCAENGRLLIRIEQTIDAEHTVAGDISQGKPTLTFTPETWSHLISQHMAQGNQSRLVGWYHTHPDFGIFLSDPDLFIHQNYFPEAWHIAVVIDPIRRQFGVFVRWKNCLSLSLMLFSVDMKAAIHFASGLPMYVPPMPNRPDKLEGALSPDSVGIETMDVS